MWLKKIIAIASLISVMACNHNPTGKQTVNTTCDTLCYYHSAPNGVADIKLTVWDNNTFNFYLRSLPQPMTNEKEETLNTSGNWTQVNNMLRLTFTANPTIVRAVFDTAYAGGNEFTVINDSIVDINNQLNSINIWGVLCDKVKK